MIDAGRKLWCAAHMEQHGCRFQVQPRRPQMPELWICEGHPRPCQAVALIAPQCRFASSCDGRHLWNPADPTAPHAALDVAAVWSIANVVNIWSRRKPICGHTCMVHGSWRGVPVCTICSVSTSFATWPRPLIPRFRQRVPAKKRERRAIRVNCTGAPNTDSTFCSR